MNKPLGFRGSAFAVALALGLPAIALGGPRDVDSLVLDQLRTQGRADVFVKMASDASLSGAESLGSKAARAQYTYDTLNAHAAASQQGLRAFLDQRAVGYQVFWINNSLLIRGASRDLVNELAARPDVAYLRGNHTVHLDVTGPARAAESIDAIEWGVLKVRADDVWTSGNTGTGIVVSNVDTGVRYTHEAVVNQYRGNNGNGTFTHDYNWYDPSRVCGNPSLAPCDNNQHGTHTMGTMTGGDGLGPFVNDIGVAPGAKWMAAKGCESSSCSDSALIGSAQWIACPTRTDGITDPDCTKAPDVVNNSWGGGGGDPWYYQYVQAWRAAGIMPVFSAGNNGSGCNSMGTPGDYPNVIGVGATTINDSLASFSSKGPGPFRPLKPDFVAPGDNVRSSTNTSNTSYGLLSGTSMAAPHMAGSIALYLSANPGAGPNQIYAAFRTTTTTNLSAPPGPDACNGRNFDVYPNFIYGWGQIDVAGALGL